MNADLQPTTIELAQEPSFRLGSLEVRPATLDVVAGDRREALEPRVMQVLVALARARGRTVSRDQLLDWCWQGRIVGDNAINQVIARLRRLAAEVGSGGFELQTIKKVGYRLVVQETSAAAKALPRVAMAVEPGTWPPAPAGSSRRRLLLTGAAALAGMVGGGIFAWRRFGPDAPEAQARRLYERGLEAQRLGERDDARQAVAYFRQATELAPGFAPAWGALALGYRVLLDSTDGREQMAFESRSREAAERALALDPNNADATAAVRLTGPNFRHWAEVESEARRLLVRFPGHWFIESVLASVLADVGRWTEEAVILERLIARDRYQPAAHTHLAVALWAAGRYSQAERRLDEALGLYPAYAPLWITKFNVLALTGKPEAAMALASDGSRPAKITVMPLDVGVACARALRSRAEPDRETAARELVQAVKDGAMWAGIAALYLCAIDRVDEAFAVIRPYFFGRPDGPPLLDAHARLSTAFLFNAPAAPLRADPRFAEYTSVLGLEDYWRRTRSAPDYRRPTPQTAS
jgi:DNA-binding winged helix-turn-helix (wHTH) protein